VHPHADSVLAAAENLAIAGGHKMVTTEKGAP